jgi:hypothetical protein
MTSFPLNEMKYFCFRSAYSTRVVSLTVSNSGNQMDSGQQQSQVLFFTDIHSVE